MRGGNTALQEKYSFKRYWIQGSTILKWLKNLDGNLPLRIGPYLFYIEEFIIQFKTTEKNIGHTRFRRNDDLLL